MIGMIGATVLAMALGMAEGVAVEQADVVSPPVLVKEVKPTYPKAAKRRKQQGTVLLTVTVDADGRVLDVRVTKPLVPRLDDEAVKAVKLWRFKPATRNGMAVAVEIEIEMTFSLRQRGSAVLTPPPRPDMRVGRTPYVRVWLRETT